ncbi:ScyD/ScyE family protein [Kribbella turkmenica]|uniref:ScyD/ScyE family protein n=1 Tax=Kribbella turkmenica TaxID=2530375 RepID=A0A4R4X771_9ACTN|nr:ScyD/ScyE family protein [Kribbella turkmenica]TDD26129.1 ScyD/ScyE family protein [Kribbella turkmenica]
MGVRTRLAAVAALALAGSVLVAAPAEAGSTKYRTTVKPVVSGLDSPRGVATFGGKIVYSVGDGSVYEAWAHNGHVIRKLGQVPGGFAPAIDTSKWGVTYALTGAGGEPGAPLPPGGATLYKLRPGKAPLKIADIGKYQLKDPDPYNTEGPATESNPFGVAALKDGTVLVADAAGNDLLRVWPNGYVKTVARLKPRTVTVPAGLGAEAPPAGTRMPAEAVATSVTVGSDGYWYVGELRGFPATPKTSQIWRIKPGSYGAVCDPANPYKGRCTRYADGYTSIVDLAGGPAGTLAVVELAKVSWLKWEMGGSPIGSLYLQFRGRHHKAGYKLELAPGKLTLPGGTAISSRGKVYVSSPLFGPGAVQQVVAKR